MKTTIRFGIAVLLLAFVVANVSLWISVANRDELSLAQAVQTYLNYYPAGLRSAGLLTLLNIACSAASLYLLIVSPPVPNRVPAVVRASMIGANALLAGWNIFTLM